MAIKIFIDQGHNPSGPNTGAEGFGLKEQDITYRVGKELAALLRADERFEVRLSRNTPEERLGTSNATSLAARVRAANAWPAGVWGMPKEAFVCLPRERKRRQQQLQLNWKWRIIIARKRNR